LTARNVIRAEGRYKQPERVGKTAVILGAGLVGTELAIYLKSLGKDPAIIEIADRMNHGSNELHAMAIATKLEQDDIAVSYKTKAIKIDDSGVLCETTGWRTIFKRKPLYMPWVKIH
jgi:pyruvate/2-oxoglutarate dehydrogenase complex dihydrolipoamide dehydrogenase (E3) component